MCVEMKKSHLLAVQMDIFEEWSCEIHMLVMVFIPSLNSILQD